MKIGILGGTFDCPHRGHLNMAEVALESGLVDEVWWVPTFIHHEYKKPESWVDRFYMVKKMIQGRENMMVSDMELNANDAETTEHILKKLDKWKGNHSFRLILGSDIYWERDKWSNFPLISELAPPLYISRPGSKELPDSVDCLLGDMNVSSSEIRDIFRQENITPEQIAYIDKYVPTEVVEWIVFEGLYK